MFHRGFGLMKNVFIRVFLGRVVSCMSSRCDRKCIEVGMANRFRELFEDEAVLSFTRSINREAFVIFVM